MTDGAWSTIAFWAIWEGCWLVVFGVCFSMIVGQFR